MTYFVENRYQKIVAKSMTKGIGHNFIFPSASDGGKYIFVFSQHLLVFRKADVAILFVARHVQCLFEPVVK